MRRLTHCAEYLAHQLLHLLNIFQGNNDPNTVPAYKALKVVMGEMAKVKNADVLIVTGYPRNMRDVVEYMALV